MAQSEARRHDPVEEALEQGREGAPPRRVDENQMLGPVDVALGADEVRFQRLLFGRGFMHIGIKSDIAQDQFTALHARLARAVSAGVEARAAQAVAAGMGEDLQAAQGIRRGRAIPSRPNARRSGRSRTSGRPSPGRGP